MQRVFARWTHFEQLPRVLDHVRRVRRIDAHHWLWEVDLAGRQVVWHARIVEWVPDRLLRWRSLWGAWNEGELAFEALSERCTRLRLRLGYEPRARVERVLARLALVDCAIRRDLERFRRGVEADARESSSGSQSEVPQSEVPQSEVPESEVSESEVPESEVPEREGPKRTALEDETPRGRGCPG